MAVTTALGGVNTPMSPNYKVSQLRVQGTSGEDRVQASLVGFAPYYPVPSGSIMNAMYLRTFPATPLVYVV